MCRCNKPGSDTDYDRVWLNGKYEPAQSTIAQYLLGRENCFGRDVHHIDFDGRNNNLYNLVSMPIGLHFSLHHFLNKYWLVCLINKTDWASQVSTITLEWLAGRDYINLGEYNANLPKEQQYR